MWTKLFDLIFNKENLKQNGLVIVIILLVLLAGGGFYVQFKTFTNHFHDAKEREDRYVKASIQDAVTNEKVVGALNKLTEVIDKKLQAR